MQYEADEFDHRLKTKGLHQVRPKVEFQPRLTILPPDLFAKYDGLSFWQNPANSLAHVIVAQPNPPEVQPSRQTQS